MRISLFMLLLCSPLFAADRPDVPQPKPTKPDEPLAKTYSASKAAAYLDGVGVNWTRDRQCVTCHTNLPYIMARPLIKGDDAGWKEVRAFLEADVAKWKATGKTRGDAYVVATTVGLIFNDLQSSNKLSPVAEEALEKMWATQKPTGEWNWLKCAWPPQEHDDYYGVVLAAVAVGKLDRKTLELPKNQEGVTKLKAYLSKNKAPDLHHRTMLLWASSANVDYMTKEARASTIADLKRLQNTDGGWSLPSFGQYKRKDGTDNDPKAASDGYGTGFAVYVLRQAGLPVSDPAIEKGALWLTTNQRESGRWFTRSLNNDKAHYITHAGSAFAIMALDACKVKVTQK